MREYIVPGTVTITYVDRSLAAIAEKRDRTELTEMFISEGTLDLRAGTHRGLGDQRRLATSHDNIRRQATSRYQHHQQEG